uniref:Uncharacterized protein n=1 Tax=Anguilla anguilla TaxID=7936 RepID=A0A0E9SKR1_ANGAN
MSRMNFCQSWPQQATVLTITQRWSGKDYTYN